MEKIKQWWREFEEKNPKLSRWVREGGLFFLVSNLITILRSVMHTLLQPLFEFMGTEAIGFPRITINFLGREFPWYIIGASEEVGGVSYLVAMLVAMWTCEIVNFFMQRKFVFRSNGNIGKQATLYFLSFLVVNCIVLAVSNFWTGWAVAFVPPFVYNLVTTFITGGVAMVVFFFANRFIFKEGKE